MLLTSDVTLHSVRFINVSTWAEKTVKTGTVNGGIPQRKSFTFYAYGNTIVKLLCRSLYALFKYFKRVDSAP